MGYGMSTLKNALKKYHTNFLKKKSSRSIVLGLTNIPLKWLKAQIIGKGIKIFPSEDTLRKGGGILSPLLCNIALNGLENAVRDGLPSPNSSEGRKISGSWVIRYADDFIVTSLCKKRVVKEHIPRVISFLSKRGLNISEKKSTILHFENEGFILKSRNFKRNNYRTSKKVFII